MSIPYILQFIFYLGHPFSYYFILCAYLEEELYDLLTYCEQNPDASDLDLKKQRVEEIGKELAVDRDNYEALRNLGKTGETFNTVISRMLKQANSTTQTKESSG